MVMSVPLLGLGFNLGKVEYEGKKRALENLGYDFGDLKYSKESSLKVNSIYDVVKMSSGVNVNKIDDDAVDAWLCGEDNKCNDGKDDGKISIFSKIGNFFEGMAKTVVGSIKTLATDRKKRIKFVASAAFMAGLVAFGGPVGAGIAAVIGLAGAAGLIINGVKDFVKATKVANQATTDAEAKAAYEQMGSGTLQVGVGVFCGKKIMTAPAFNPKQPPVFVDEFNANLADVTVLVDKS